MPPQVNRRYDSPARRAAAAQTRRDVLAAACDLFGGQGFAATSVAEIARRAKVSVDTVYSSVGRKPELLLAVHDMELAGGPDPVPALERDYVRAVREAPTARLKIEVYAAALAEVLPRTVPLLLALREAGATDPACRDLSASIVQRRAANMRLFAQDLRATGELRPDLTDGWVADLVWSMNGPEYFSLIGSRGLGPDGYARLLVEVWAGVLLSEPVRGTS